MNTGDFTIKVSRLVGEPFDVDCTRLDKGGIIATWERLSEPFRIVWKRIYETIVDLVAFSAADAHFLTKNGYTIIVKI